MFAFDVAKNTTNCSGSPIRSLFEREVLAALLASWRLTTPSRPSLVLADFGVTWPREFLVHIPARSRRGLKNPLLWANLPTTVKRRTDEEDSREFRMGCSAFAELPVQINEEMPLTSKPMTSKIVLAACFAVLIAAIFASGAIALPTAGSLWLCESDQSYVSQLNPDTGAIIQQPDIVIDGITVESCHGLAFHPQTGELYALVEWSEVDNRSLVRFDADTGIGTDVGPAGGIQPNLTEGDYFIELSFAPDGRMYTVGGCNCDECTEESIYQIDPATALVTEIVFTDGGIGPASMGVGGDGHIYYAGEEIYRVNRTTLSVTEINPNAEDVDEAMAWDATRDLFLATNDSELYTMDLNGNVAEIVGSDVDTVDDARGMAVFGGIDISVLEIPAQTGWTLGLLSLLLVAASVWRMRQV